jgi:hypothetical protein
VIAAHEGQCASRSLSWPPRYLRAAER